MAGKIKLMIDAIVEQRSHGNPTLMQTTRTKLLLKGVNVDQYTSTSEDDPRIISKLGDIAREMNVKL